MKEVITKEKFAKYMKVQKEGKYNMLTEGIDAANEAGLTFEEYKEIIRNYSNYYDEYSDFTL